MILVSRSANIPERWQTFSDLPSGGRSRLQFPAIIVGWMIGNTLGALAAYLKGGFDKVLMPVSIFVSNFPAFGMAVILLVIFGVGLKMVPNLGRIWV